MVKVECQEMNRRGTKGQVAKKRGMPVVNARVHVHFEATNSKDSGEDVLDVLAALQLPHELQVRGQDRTVLICVFLSVLDA